MSAFTMDSVSKKMRSILCLEDGLFCVWIVADYFTRFFYELSVNHFSRYTK